MRTAKTPPTLMTLILLTAFSTLSLNMFLPSLANIAADFGTSYSTVSLAIAGYLAITAVVQLIVGPLSDRIGRRPVLLIALVVFTIASVFCAFANDIWTFLAFRMLQSGIVAGYTLSLAIVRDTTSERKAAGLIGYISMVMAIAPMLGPMFGGVLDAAFGWRASFHFYAITGFVLLVICWVDLGETKPDSSTDKSPASDRFMDLLKEPQFWIYSLCSTLSRGTFFIFITGAPLVALAQFEISTITLGIYIGTITAGFMFGSFIAGRLAPRHKPTSMMIAGRVVACVGTGAGILALLMGYESPILFFTSTVFVGIGNGITIPSSSAAAMSVRPKLAGSAAGLSGAMVVTGGAILTAMTGYLLPEEGPALSLLLLLFGTSLVGLLIVLLPVTTTQSAIESEDV